MNEEQELSQHVFLRLTKDGEELYEGEIQPGRSISLPDGLRVEVLWIRTHHEPVKK